jgi:CysZ protein
MARMQANIPGWLSWLEWILWPLFALALLIVVFYSFTLLANLIAAPFNGLLAEKTEALLTGGSGAASSGDFRKLLRALPGTLLDEARKIIYALLWTIPFLLLAFVVPLVGPLIWFLFTAWMLTVQYSDFPMGNHGLKFRDMRALLRRRRFLSIGFGAAAAGLTMIPVLNFIVMPAAVAGATAMWVRELSGPASSPA